ncbi:hypothetical protein HK105_200905 [Polyrhizophydium stewartii]|uniref:Uncharacterized protein n=1 Tax=Polyrhizophydium stewartii TaxID=2732419 RepID=A0ABR4NIB1_9FUNG
MAIRNIPVKTPSPPKAPPVPLDADLQLRCQVRIATMSAMTLLAAMDIRKQLHLDSSGRRIGAVLAAAAATAASAMHERRRQRLRGARTHAPPESKRDALDIFEINKSWLAGMARPPEGVVGPILFDQHRRLVRKGKRATKSVRFHPMAAQFDFLDKTCPSRLKVEARCPRVVELLPEGHHIPSEEWWYTELDEEEPESGAELISPVATGAPMAAAAAATDDQEKQQIKLAMKLSLTEASKGSQPVSNAPKSDVANNNDDEEMQVQLAIKLSLMEANKGSQPVSNAPKSDIANNDDDEEMQIKLAMKLSLTEASKGSQPVSNAPKSDVANNDDQEEQQIKLAMKLSLTEANKGSQPVSNAPKSDVANNDDDEEMQVQLAIKLSLMEANKGSAQANFAKPSSRACAALARMAAEYRAIAAANAMYEPKYCPTESDRLNRTDDEMRLPLGTEMAIARTAPGSSSRLLPLVNVSPSAVARLIEKETERILCEMQQLQLSRNAHRLELAMQPVPLLTFGLQDTMLPLLKPLAIIQPVIAGVSPAQPVGVEPSAMQPHAKKLAIESTPLVLSGSLPPQHAKQERVRYSVSATKFGTQPSFGSIVRSSGTPPVAGSVDTLAAGIELVNRGSNPAVASVASLESDRVQGPRETRGTQAQYATASLDIVHHGSLLDSGYVSWSSAVAPVSATLSSELDLHAKADPANAAANSSGPVACRGASLGTEDTTPRLSAQDAAAGKPSASSRKWDSWLRRSSAKRSASSNDGEGPSKKRSVWSGIKRLFSCRSA